MTANAAKHLRSRRRTENVKMGPWPPRPGETPPTAGCGPGAVPSLLGARQLSVRQPPSPGCALAAPGKQAAHLRGPCGPPPRLSTPF